ncbi:MAG: hypothetical protein WCD42_07425, partial [Rhizomicrobium sp.]
MQFFGAERKALSRSGVSNDHSSPQLQIIFMNKMLTAVAVLGLLCLSACGSKTDANEKNFGAALSQYFEKQGAQCLSLGIYDGQWPVEVT